MYPFIFPEERRGSRWPIRLLFLAGLTLALFTPVRSAPPYVLVVSFDGFRADYLNWYPTPHFDRLGREGVRAAGLKPVFPSVTFPNHYSLATGMYPAKHGLVDNQFYDPRLETTYRISDRAKVEDARWYGGEPIWVTAEKQGLKSACYFWVGSEAPVGGWYPSIWKRYDQAVPFQARIDSAVAWFQLPAGRRPHLVMLYFHEPDSSGHEYGPRAPATRRAVTRVDSVLGSIMEGMRTTPVHDSLNIIVVSDHGMAEVSPHRTINLEDYANLEGVRRERAGPLVHLYDTHLLGSYLVYRRLVRAPHISVYRKRRIPRRFHYRDHRSIGDLLVLADEGWLVLGEDQLPGEITSRGAHGYDNDLPSMRAIFLADGPAFREGYSTGVIENIHLYPLIAHILGLTPAAGIDGRLEAVVDLLKGEREAD